MENVRNIVGGKDNQVIIYCASKECHASEKAAKKMDCLLFNPASLNLIKIFNGEFWSHLDPTAYCAPEEA